MVHLIATTLAPAWTANDGVEPCASNLPLASMIRPHPGAYWAAHQGERAEAIRRENERTMADYDAMAKQREEREAAEAQKGGNGGLPRISEVGR